MQTVVHCPNANLSIVPEGWSLPFQPSGHCLHFLVSRASFNEMTPREGLELKTNPHTEGSLSEQMSGPDGRRLEPLAVEGSAGPGFQSQLGRQPVRCAYNLQ